MLILESPHMHEMSVAQNILEIIGDTLASSGKTRVRSVQLRIGQMSGIVRDSLEFCFQVITEGTPVEGAILEIEEPPLTARCNACRQTSGLEYGMFICPSCGSNDVAILSGTELQVVSLTLDDDSRKEQA
jgi:hydrogenase nickel incorporation protein HypA/HybF